MTAVCFHFVPILFYIPLLLNEPNNVVLHFRWYWCHICIGISLWKSASINDRFGWSDYFFFIQRRFNGYFKDNEFIGSLKCKCILISRFISLIKKRLCNYIFRYMIYMIFYDLWIIHSVYIKLCNIVWYK